MDDYKRMAKENLVQLPSGNKTKGNHSFTLYPKTQRIRSSEVVRRRFRRTTSLH